METSVALPLSVHVAVRELRALHGDVAPARPRQPRGLGYAEPTEPRLHLNPAFSEWLMGLPGGWTCLDGDVIDVAAHLRPHDRWSSWRGGDDDDDDGDGGGGGGGGWSAGSQVALGVARQMDRCRTVGNSVVPTCVGVAWRVLTGLRHAVNPRTDPAPRPARSKHRLDPTRRVPVPIPDPRVRTEWGGDGMGRDGEGGGDERSGRWKPWSVPWPTFFAPIDSNPLEGRKNKRKSGGPGPTDESAPETEDARGGSPSTSAREKLEPWGDAEEARGASRRAKFTRERSGSPGMRRPSVQGLTRSKSSQNREGAVAARDSRRDRINALTASPDVRNGASALLRQLWESMLSARAEYGRVAEALRSHTRRNPGESARVDWISPSPLPRLFRSPAEVRERRETTHQSARVGGGRVHAESDRKIGTREPKLRAKTPFGVSVDGIDWPQPPPSVPRSRRPRAARGWAVPFVFAAVRLRDHPEDGSSLRVAPSPS